MSPGCRREIRRDFGAIVVQRGVKVRHRPDRTPGETTRTLKPIRHIQRMLWESFSCHRPL
jgi:hypothetical protein